MEQENIYIKTIKDVLKSLDYEFISLQEIHQGMRDISGYIIKYKLTFKIPNTKLYFYLHTEIVIRLYKKGYIVVLEQSNPMLKIEIPKKFTDIFSKILKIYYNYKHHEYLDKIKDDVKKKIEKKELIYSSEVLDVIYEYINKYKYYNSLKKIYNKKINRNSLNFNAHLIPHMSNYVFVGQFNIHFESSNICNGKDTHLDKVSNQIRLDTNNIEEFKLELHEYFLNVFIANEDGINYVNIYDSYGEYFINTYIIVYLVNKFYNKKTLKNGTSRIKAIINRYINRLRLRSKRNKI